MVHSVSTQGSNGTAGAEQPQQESKKADDDVIDAEFEDVKDDKK